MLPVPDPARPSRSRVAPGAGGTHRLVARRVLLALVLLLVTHGSLYPWRFVAPPSLDAAWHALWSQRTWWSGLGDVAGNVVLFVPLGWLALAGRRERAAARAIVALIAGLAFALVLQVLQIWLPERSPSLSDVFWNGVGITLGFAIARLAQRLSGHRSVHAGAPLHAGALALIVLWLAIEWWPFVPTIDWQQIKNALKPLLLRRPELAPRSFVEVGLGTAIVVQALGGTRRRVAAAVALVGAALLGKLFVSGQTLSPSHLAGWFAGLAAGMVSWRAGARAAAIAMLVASIGWFTLDELRPFAVVASPGSFSWIPFVGSLRGSLVVNVLALAWLAFWLGAAMVSAQALGLPLGAMALALGLWALLLEALQVWLPGRTADVTPALLPLAWWLLLRALPAPRAVSIAR